jgi:Cd(II)/Pb(II)-responsive transcriptional regulator
MSEHVSIGELAKETGVKVVTIRYYEQVRVLPPPERTQGNYRTYSREHAKRLRFIRRCRDLGFSLDEIRDLLRLSSEDAQSCADVCLIAERHLEAVQEKIADLNRLASELRSISASCNGNRPMAECRIIEALSSNQMGKEQPQIRLRTS